MVVSEHVEIRCLSQLRCDKHEFRLHNLIECNMTCNLGAALSAEEEELNMFLLAIASLSQRFWSTKRKQTTTKKQIIL